MSAIPPVSADTAAVLNNLHDIVPPPPTPYWPPAPGWYLLAALLLIALCGLLALLIKRWRADAWRRQALRALPAIGHAMQDKAHRPAALGELASLIRWAALQQFPTQQVVPLAGREWMHFLDTAIGGNAFSEGEGKLLATAPYLPSAAIAELPQAELDAMLSQVQRWLRRSRQPHQRRRARKEAS